ncbi:MAG: hypothetical protein E6J06_11465 [Chloroflexi bacterium]|nr:MAG: hypothetical protein E6J06_11465 [Chloroflexota bacterium]
MVPADFQPFFTASVAASAALIGLLFVSISIAPERVFGENAESSRQAQALSSFTALTNVFFISFASLIPKIPIGPVVTVVAVPAILQTLGVLLLLPMWRADHTLRRGLFLFLISFGIYGFEISIGIQLWLGSSNTGAMTALLELLLGAYAIGLGRAWELLGARRLGWTGWIGLFGDALRRARQSRPSRQEPPRGKT